MLFMSLQKKPNAHGRMNDIHDLSLRFSYFKNQRISWPSLLTQYCRCPGESIFQMQRPSKLRLPNHERTYNKNENKRKEKRRKKKGNLAFVKFRFQRMPLSTFVLTNVFKRENVTINKCLHLHDWWNNEFNQFKDTSEIPVFLVCFFVC